MQRVYRWDRLNNEQFARLDRQTTVLLLPLGQTQQHGPHLPHGTPNMAANHIARETAELLTLTDRDRVAVILPLLAYGVAAPVLKTKKSPTIASSLSISPQTLESVILDIVEGVVSNGFRYLFALGYHASETHARAVQKALRTMKRKYPALVAEDINAYLQAGAAVNAAPDLRTLTNRRVSPAEQDALDQPGHADTLDTAIMLALDPNFVSPDYVTLEGIPESTAAGMDDWPGYYGSPPSLAEADLGKAVLAQIAYRAASLIRKALDGESLSSLPRFPDF